MRLHRHIARQYRSAAGAVNCISLMMCAIAASLRPKHHPGTPHALDPSHARNQSSLNLIDAWAPSQKGLFLDAPHRHSVTRLRTS
jgi:hypothetical protein